jgi:indolepyruvate decarboxylase
MRVPGIILVVNNDGYTVERAIHGPGRRYNDIARWRWADLPWAFGASPDAVRSVRVETAAELSGALAAAEGEPGILTFIEAVVDPLDVPPLLTKVAEAAAAANAHTSR